MSSVQEAPRAGADRRQAVLEAIPGRIAPVPVSGLYRLGLCVVAVAMVLLPLVYIGLIGLAAYGVYWHATENLVLFDQVRGRGAVVVYLAPLITGVVLVFFMIKPLFAPRGQESKPYRLRREDEPLLFDYVDRLSQSVHAPAPKEIWVDSEVNASAGFRRGMWSFLGGDLVLTIGVPLAAGMSLRQLSGVLAHEFGHFSQGLGMRLLARLAHTAERIEALLRLPPLPEPAEEKDEGS